MDWPCRWATLYLLINVSNIFCQNVPLERMLPEVSAQPQTTNLKREVILTQSPSKAQLINALFSYVTAKGLLPKTSQIIQPTLPQEKPQNIATRHNAPKLTFGPLQPQMPSNCDKQPIISSIPAVSVNSIQNQMSPPATSCSQGPMVQPTLQTESVSWTLPPQTYQGGPLQPQMSSNCDKQPIISSIPAVSVNSIQNQVSPPATSCSQGRMVEPKIQTESVSWTLPPQTCQGGPLQPQMLFSCDKRPIISSIPAVSVNSKQNQMSPPATSCSQGLMVQPKIQTESVSWTLPPQTCQGGPLQPQMSFNCDKQPIISSIPAVTENSIQNQMSPPATSCSQGLMVQPKIQTESVSWTLPPQTCQGGYLENCACAQPSHTVWQIPQPSQPVTTLNSCPSNQPFVFHEAIPPLANWQISPPSRIFTPINTECSTVEKVYETNCGMLTEEPLLVTCDSKPGIPINLQINMPSPNDQCPSITIITNAPTNPEPIAAFSPYAYAFPPPPIMMRKSRSCLSKLLPILLLALIEDCESCGGCGPCPYNYCDSDDIIPIPYPIPIPVNNPMINVCNSPCSSRN